MGSYYRLTELGFDLASGAYVIPRADFSALEGADALLKQAELACSDLRQKAREAFEEERRRGYEEGLAQGRLDSIERLTRENIELDAALLGIQRELTVLVAECVRKLVTSFDDVERAETVVKTALTRMRRERRAELRVSGELYAPLRARISEILKDYPEVELVDVVLDDSLEQGRVIFETSVGRVDGNIGRRLDDLHAVICSAQPGSSSSIAEPGKETLETVS